VRAVAPNVHRDTGIRQARAKTDRLDARTLAKPLWAGELDGVWTPDERIRAMRRRLSRRAQLVRARSRAKNEVHAALMRCLKDRPPASDLFGVKGRAWLAEQHLPVCERETVTDRIRPRPAAGWWRCSPITRRPRGPHARPCVPRRPASWRRACERCCAGATRRF
jgi:transposase